MGVLTIRLPDDEHRRLRALAESRGTTLNRLIEGMAAVMLAECDARTPVKLRAARGAGGVERGLELLKTAAGPAAE